jgi:CO/xanthine dehydrogenase Mo-binding subunit
MDGPAPAIVNAVEDATGVRFCSIPLLPEDLFEALRNEPVEQDVPSPLGDSA